MSINIGSDNGLSSSEPILLTEPLGTNFSETLYEIHTLSE